MGGVFCVREEERVYHEHMVRKVYRAEEVVVVGE